MGNKGILTVLSGFSGAGKGTIMKELIGRYPYFLSVSATTRKPRVGEVNGVDYFFHTKETFEQMIEKGELIEWAEYVGNYYGTPKEAVEKQLAEGKDVLLEIEMQGGMLVKKQFPDALLLFVTPPTAEDLKKRLAGRGTETEEEIERRLDHALEEASYMKAYDYIVVNDVLEEAVLSVHSMIQNQHCKVENCEEQIHAIESDLKQFAKGD